MKKEMEKKAPSTRAVAIWLFLCALAVFALALVGAATRLTESGLSIVEWKPVTGALPPLSEADWAREFDLYRQSPQYRKVNMGMSLAEFRHIYLWEWVHRFLGRVVGVLYALPLAWFMLRRRLPRESLPALCGVLLLGGAQGAMGWYMVKSGLLDHPAVSHYRLAMHLMLAFLIYGCLFRLGLSFSVRPDRDAGRLSRMRSPVRALIALAALAMTWGAFTAGLDAGLLYNTFPLMDGHVVPPELAQHRPVWKAFFEEPATVQFTHRVLAILTLVMAFVVAGRFRDWNPPPRVARLLAALKIAVVAQAGLGVATLLSHVQIAVAVAHQAGALVLLGVLVWLLHEIPHVPYDKGK